MKRKPIFRLFIKGFGLSVIIVISLLGILLLGYRLLIKQSKLSNSNITSVITILEERETDGKETSSMRKASVDDISRNVILSIEEETGEIEKIILEIFHTKNKRLYYITIPVRTQFTMSEFLYQKMNVVDPTMPQIIKLSAMMKYLPKESRYEYGALLIEDMLKIKISYYTVIPKAEYQKIFASKKGKSGAEEYEIFSRDYEKYLKKIQKKEQLKEYIEGGYPSVISNLELSDKLSYLDSYIKTPWSNIYFGLLVGDNQNSAYIIDLAQVKQQLEECLKGKEVINKPEIHGE